MFYQWVAAEEITSAKLKATGVLYGTDTGSGDAYAVTSGLSIAALVTGMELAFKAAANNVGACTLNLDGLGAVAIKKHAFSGIGDLEDNDIRSGQIVKVIYDGTFWQMQDRGRFSAALADQTLTDGASIDWDLNSGVLADVTLAGNRALNNPTNQSLQMFARLMVKQDSTGNRTLTFGSAYVFPVDEGTVKLSPYPNAIDIFDFESDGTSMFNVARQSFVGAYTSTRAYFAGGRTLGTSTEIATNNGLDFSTDTTAMVTKGALATAKSASAGANSATVGYFAGGWTGVFVKVADNQGLAFATDTTTMVTKGALSSARFWMASANSSTVGYFTGGFTSNGSATLSSTEAITFASDTVAMATRGALTAARGQLNGGGNSETMAYFTGGESADAVACSAVSHGLTFASDTTAMLTRGSLNTAKGGSGTANSSIKAYFTAGFTGSNPGAGFVATTEALVFATESSSMVTAGAGTFARGQLAGANSLTKGYFAGGETGGGGMNTTTDGLDFVTDTTAMVTKGALVSIRHETASAQGSASGAVIYR